jgi:type IV fimbrial biogenesis protein FimT
MRPIGDFSASRTRIAAIDDAPMVPCRDPRFGYPRGMTLWELLCVLAVVGVLLGIGVPSLRSIALDARRTADINAFVGAVQLARSEAAKRGRSVVLCKTVDRRICAGADTRYDTGWMVFVDEDETRPPRRSGDEPLLLAYVPSSSGPIVSNRALYEFRAYRRRSTNGTVTFCDERGAAAARAVIISYTGRPRTAAIGPGNRALVCKLP